mmetsp:Transcript_7980/g.24947  ORF Transcript_7980/g.24947 Transcript_7980/m.24947 type:complete len:315 (+) Transcript_7980:94-1038(+)
MLSLVAARRPAPPLAPCPAVCSALRAPRVLHLDRRIAAPNVVRLPMPAAALDAARAAFDGAIRPHLERNLIEDLEAQPVPCSQLRSAHGNFFVMRGGSSTDESKRHSSDLAWISVDDMPTWEAFRKIFDLSGVADAVRPLVDCDEGIRLYSSFYVVRSRCASANLHVDWGDGVGTNAFTLLAPLEDYSGVDDFQLLYEASAAHEAVAGGVGGGDGGLAQYRYRLGEAIVFGSHFYHSTEPGASAGGAAAPHVYLCFTFGSDRAAFFEEHIAPTISGYQSRLLVAADGSVRLTELGRHLEAEAARGHPPPCRDAM